MNNTTETPKPPFNFEKYSIGTDDIKAEAAKLLSQTNPTADNGNLFIVKPASYWIEQAKNRPVQKMLFGEFWFDNEICILFADTNLGKSILAVQIGNSISQGLQIPGFELQTPGQAILYFDFELSDKQFENRYAIDYEEHYDFDPNFLRVEINPDAVFPEGMDFEDYLSQSLERAVVEKQAKVLIIDNLTYLKNETEKAKDALPLMKHLKALKSKYGLSILVLAHTPKRDMSKPITRNDLSGSKMLINFCDSAFAIGESVKDANLRYLKQIKQRNTEQLYGAENVCVCQISKPHNFLQFEFIGHSTEREHLMEPSENSNQVMEQNVLGLKQNGLSLREIGTQLNISHMKVSRILKACNIL